MKHVMLDLETLGTNPGCVILSIGAVEFGPAGLGAEFYSVLSIGDQKSVGLVEDPNTLAWWLKQSEAARRVFREEQQPLNEALALFESFCAGIAPPSKLFVWGNGSDFDNPILRAVYEAAATNPVWKDRRAPWGTYNNRCYRTLKNLPLSCRPQHKPEVPHHALYDAKAQALNAIQYLNELDPNGTWG